MSRHCASVCIVTTDGPAGRCGITVSSVTSVSDAPPTLLCCVNKQARTCPILMENGVFAVSVLQEGSEDLSGAFAGAGDLSLEERFSLASWKQHHQGTGSPLLENARVALDCRVVDTLDCGSHRIFIGRVQGVHACDGAKSPLIYVDRRYGATVSL